MHGGWMASRPAVTGVRSGLGARGPLRRMPRHGAASPQEGIPLQNRHHAPTASCKRAFMGFTHVIGEFKTLLTENKAFAGPRVLAEDQTVCPDVVKGERVTSSKPDAQLSV